MPTVVAALLAATALVACSPADNGTNGAAPVTSESGRSPDPTTPPSTPDCTSGDLAASEFGPHLRTASIRTSSAEYFHFDVRENAYDSCRDLSWVLLDGTIDDINGRNARPVGTVVLFTGDRVVGNHQPHLYAGVDNVRRLADNAALITWRHNQTPRTSEESFELLDGHLRLVAYSTPDELRGAVPVIDFRNPPLDSQAGLPPEGNVHGSPYAAALPTGRYLLPLNGEQSLQCDVGRDDGVIADCWATFPAHWDEDGANRVRYVVSPARIETDTGVAPDARGLPTLDRGAVYRVGTAVVDLREADVAKIGLEPGQGVRVSPGQVGQWPAT